MIGLLKKMSVMVVGLFAIMLMASGTAQAATTNGRIIDDAVFDASGSMSANDIQAFLNQFPNSCLKNYTDSMPSSDPTQAYFNYSGTGSVAQIIRRVADVYGVNPRVMLTKLEQEENLVTGNAGCAQWRYASAVGFHCFDGANPRTTVFNGTTIQTCVDRDENMGVARQLTKGMWTLKWGKERANGNLAWMVPDDASITYYGPMTQGNRKRCGSCATVYYDGYWKGVYLETGATASLYNYTPYLGQAFGSIWEGWWGAGTTVGVPYAWQVVSQSASRDLAAIPAGEKFTYTLKAKNMGNTTWTRTGNNPVRLGSSNPRDRCSAWATTSWLSCARVANMEELTVAPGETATFTTTMQAPTRTGSYNEHFSLLAEGITWMNETGMYWTANVVQPNLSASVTASTIPTTMTAGASVAATVTLTNTGNVTWYPDGVAPVRLTTNPLNRTSPFAAATWLDQTRLSAVPSAVAPGASVTMSAPLKAPPINGAYGETFKLYAENIGPFGPTIGTGITVSGGTAVAKTALYRHYNPGLRAHFFTIDAAESQRIRTQGWNFEGVGFSVSTDVSQVPVYRHYNPSLGVHFFTIDAAESQRIRSQGWNYEGIAFYVASGSSAMPVYRHYNASWRRHFFTADITESLIIRTQGWNFEGVAFSVYP